MLNLGWEYCENLLKDQEDYLFDLLRTGKLQPYDKNGKPIFCPHDFHEYYYLFHDIPSGEVRNTRLKTIIDSEFPDGYDSDPDYDKKWSWKFLWVPEDETKKEELRSILKGSKFKKSDFDNFIKSKEVKKSNPSTQCKNQFSTSSNTRWSDIRIHFAEYENVEITIKGRRATSLNYKSIDCFVNNKNKKPTKGWALLFAFARYQGDLPRHVLEEKAISKHVSNLQKSIKKLFPGIADKPFKAYSAGKGWELRITLSLSRNLSEKYHQ